MDLDGALAGHSVNAPAIRAVLEQVSVPVQLGGGIRSAEDVRAMLDLGISRCIIGTKAAEHPEFMRELVETFGPERIVAGVDAKRRNGSGGRLGENQFRNCAGALYENERVRSPSYCIHGTYPGNGTLTGPNIPYTRMLAEKTGLDVIASGGVSSVKDLETLSENGIPGVIIGKALYEKRISLPDAVARFQ